MKQLFGFLFLIAVALLLLTVIQGLGGIFGAISTTWTVDQTAEIATGFTTVLQFGGIVVVATLGYGLFVTMSRGSSGWSARGGRPQGQQQHGDYIDVLPYQQPTLLPPPSETQSWHALDTADHDTTYYR